MSYKSLAEEFLAVQSALDAAKAEVTRIQKEFDHLRYTKIPDQLSEDDVKSINLTDVAGLAKCRLGVTDDMRVSVKAEKREDAYLWLEEHGHGDIVVDFVHSSTLKAFVKQYIKLWFDKPGEVPELPEELFEWTPIQRASVTRR